MWETLVGEDVGRIGKVRSVEFPHYLITKRSKLSRDADGVGAATGRVISITQLAQS